MAFFPSYLARTKPALQGNSEEQSTTGFVAVGFRVVVILDFEVSEAR